MTLHGVLPVRKPKGFTSHDIVGKIRRLAKQKRVGHTGTLDPEVEGVLPICLGQATRLAEYIQDMPKKYRGSVTLGTATDTEDQTGQVIEKVAIHNLPTESEIVYAMKSMVGEIEQVPPMYSAVKVNGKRLYELARKGEVIERKARRVQIYDFEFLGMDRGEKPTIHFTVTCSKGTYVRTLCVDLGKKLDLPSHMSYLIRIQSGSYSLEDCVTLEQIETVANTGDWQSILHSMGEAVSTFSKMIVSEAQEFAVLNGKALQVEDPPETKDGLIRIFSDTGRFLALYREKEKGLLIPEKVFRDVE
ncbi:tRNA pseudouridine(55) synthase TruB [Risungbinella massiliensis]|uniref:tRNA pseudouridine(55) synthase TruB n=1 Tax=Risungbinella massiliensis TaxID=1329796 RepID=UPI0005CC4011|nr:tRNA pseudouridine(55) synthase TruB [Risungbinella massiliensis]